MNRLSGIEQKYEKLEHDHPYLTSIGETALLFGLKYGIKKAGNKLGIPLGHGRQNSPTRQKIIDNHPYLAAGLATVVAPLSEEILFRELPSRYIDKKDLEPGTPEHSRTKRLSNLGFTAIHAGPHALPITQYISGANYQRIHERRGLKASVAAHAANNLFAIAEYAVKTRRQKQSKG